MQLIREAFQKGKEVMTKDGFADLVTETDRKVEELVISHLQKKFPLHRFECEVYCNCNGTFI